MTALIAVLFLLPLAAGTWWLSRHIHPSVLILVGASLHAFGSWMVFGLHGGLFFTLLQVLGTVVIIHGIALWVKRTKKARQQGAASLPRALAGQSEGAR